MKVLVAGAAGMVGRAVVEFCGARGDEVMACDRHVLDIADPDQASRAVEGARPDVIINCAAWTDVDGCELDPERAYAANAAGPGILAAAARQTGASLVTISTDYVFDGEKDGFYTQRDDPNPTSVYARAKLEGERRAQAASARTVIVRTGWIFGQGGKNYLSRMIEFARRGDALRTISDAFGTPTFAPHLAARLRLLAERDLPGIYHVVNSGDGASFEGFARAAVHAAGLANVRIEPVTLDSLRRPAPRPRNSRLSCLQSEALGLPPLPDWRAALREFASET